MLLRKVAITKMLCLRLLASVCEVNCLSLRLRPVHFDKSGCTGTSVSTVAAVFVLGLHQQWVKAWVGNTLKELWLQKGLIVLLHKIGSLIQKHAKPNTCFMSDTAITHNNITAEDNWIRNSPAPAFPSYVLLPVTFELQELVGREIVARKVNIYWKIGGYIQFLCTGGNNTY